MKSAIRTLPVVAVLIGGGAACQTTPRLPGHDVDVVARGDIETLNPVDVAVLPIRVTEIASKAPVSTLRRSAMKGLVRRRYSPLSAEIVDERIAAAGGARNAIEASYSPGDVQEDAVLEVTVTRWDAPSWDVRREVDVALEARIIDPRDPLGPELWAARLDRSFSSTGGSTVPVSELRAMQETCDAIFAELFAQLPARDLSIDLELDPVPGGPETGPETGPESGPESALVDPYTPTDDPLGSAPVGADAIGEDAWSDDPR